MTCNILCSYNILLVCVCDATGLLPCTVGALVDIPVGIIVFVVNGALSEATEVMLEARIGVEAPHDTIVALLYIGAIVLGITAVQQHVTGALIDATYTGLLLDIGEFWTEASMGTLVL